MYDCFSPELPDTPRHRVKTRIRAEAMFYVSLGYLVFYFEMF